MWHWKNQFQFYDKTDKRHLPSLHCGTDWAKFNIFWMIYNIFSKIGWMLVAWYSKFKYTMIVFEIYKQFDNLKGEVKIIYFWNLRKIIIIKAFKYKILCTYPLGLCRPHPNIQLLVYVYEDAYVMLVRRYEEEKWRK